MTKDQLGDAEFNAAASASASAPPAAPPPPPPPAAFSFDFAPSSKVTFNSPSMDLQSRFNALQAEHHELLGENSGLRAENEAIKSQAISLSKKLTESEQSTTELTNKCAELTGHVERKEFWLKSGVLKIKQCNRDIEKLEKEVKELEDKVMNSDRSYIAIKGRFDEKQNALTEARFKLASVTAERDGLQVQVDGIPGLNVANEALSFTITGLEADVAERENEIHTLDQKLEWCGKMHGGVPDDFAEQSSIAGVRGGPHAQGMGMSPTKGRSLSSEVTGLTNSQVEAGGSDEEDEEHDEESEIYADAGQDFLADDYEHIPPSQLEFFSRTMASTSPISASPPTGPTYVDAATNTLPAPVPVPTLVPTTTTVDAATNTEPAPTPVRMVDAATNTTPPPSPTLTPVHTTTTTVDAATNTEPAPTPVRTTTTVDAATNTEPAPTPVRTTTTADASTNTPPVPVRAPTFIRTTTADASTNTPPAPPPIRTTTTIAAPTLTTTKKATSSSSSYYWHLLQALLLLLLLWMTRTYQQEQLWLGANDATRLHILTYRRYSNAQGLM